MILSLTKSLFPRRLRFNGCELLRSIATKERKEQIPARAWLHSIALDCQTQFPQAKTRQLRPVAVKATPTSAMQVAGAAALENSMLGGTLIVARCHNNHQICIVTKGHGNLRVSATEPFNWIRIASSRWGRPATAVNHSILFVTPNTLAHQKSSSPDVPNREPRFPATLSS